MHKGEFFYMTLTGSCLPKLDASAVIKTQKRQSEILDIIELHTREYIYKIHQKRIAKLKQISQF